MLGTFVDHYQPLGAVALVAGRDGRQMLVYPIEENVRYSLTQRPGSSPDRHLYFSSASVDPTGRRTLTNGVDAERLGVAVLQDEVQLFGNRMGTAPKPWMRAKRWPKN